MLMDREDTCHRTCFSLQLDGNVLDNFAELKSIEGLQEGSLLKVVEGQRRVCLIPVVQREQINICDCVIIKFTALHALWVSLSLQSRTRCARLASTCGTSETC